MSGSLDWDELVLSPCQENFGENVIWKSSDGVYDQKIIGIFDNGYRSLETLGGIDGLTPSHITTSLPVLGVRASSFPSGYPLQGDRLKIRGKSFVIQEVQPDSHGALHLVLNAGKAPLEVPEKPSSQVKPWQM